MLFQFENFCSITCRVSVIKMHSLSPLRCHYSALKQLTKAVFPFLYCHTVVQELSFCKLDLSVITDGELTPAVKLASSGIFLTTSFVLSTNLT